MINYKMHNLKKRKLRSDCLSSHQWLTAKISISQPFCLLTIYPLPLGLKGFYCNRNKDTNKQVDKRMKRVSKKVKKNHIEGLRSSSSESINVYLRATRNTHDHVCRPVFMLALFFLHIGITQSCWLIPVRYLASNDLHASFGNSGLKVKSNLLLYLTLTLLQCNLLKVLEFFPI